MIPAPRIFALIVAAGTGTRAGGVIPKQYHPVAKKPLLRYSCEAFLREPQIAGVQVVIHPEHNELYRISTDGLSMLPPVHGGAMRSDSVLAGLNALLPHRPDYVMIHDAARPFLSRVMIRQLIAALSPEHAVLPALPAADTMRRFEGNLWHEVAREGLLRMQTPQCFPYSRLRTMMLAAPSAATDEGAIWLAEGGSLSYVAGDEDLRKVTTASDIAWAERHAGGSSRMAVGMGFDVHALMPSGDKGVIRLGGIDIEHGHKLHGHSDADVVLHAIVDALLGAVGAGDIGSFFPPTDMRWQGADSIIFIGEAMAQVLERGGIVEHLDVTIIGEQPKISPHRDAMRAAIADMLKLPLSHVSIKATTTEKLGFTGREEGIACQAVATVRLPAEAAA